MPLEREFKLQKVREINATHNISHSVHVVVAVYQYTLINVIGHKTVQLLISMKNKKSCNQRRIHFTLGKMIFHI